ncbi:hypothetical protein DICPUDRAFT_75704 [Dictyostelium purpureum]|uniref:BTB domain-containing protein n=1 Tax=Dictyostelium purpureum TaxID=5786 RepID=F0ZBF6_DICPU|nr:uncharacterized protein DICPUDRAFT_75704 [Dictyostelium purpureum]EGC38739.1 hypothetical protein DICPUDRAFT_75704 [Dictyostelium purpureum]|eukprot:XP_003284730.1 hypothetical protein DICPUDRAFT_75704 [Dictyostelium purpureum]
MEEKINKKRESILFKKVIELYESNSNIEEISQCLLDSLNQVKEKPTNDINDDNLLKIKIIFALGKIYLKFNYNIFKLIKIIEEELKKNFNVSLASMLYRCFYFKVIKEENEEKLKKQFKQSKMYSLHNFTKNLIDNIKKENIQDISMSKFSCVQTNFKIINNGERIDFEFNYENEIYANYKTTFDSFEKIHFKVPINLVSCGRYFITALDKNGLVWNWGAKHEPNSYRQKTPLFPHKFKGNVKSIATGFHHSLALTDKGDVYGWGSNSFGCLSNITRDGTFSSKIKQIEMPEKIIKIEAGGFNSAFISSSGLLYVLGRNDRLQLGFQDIPSTYPNIDGSKKAISFVPEISVSPSLLPHEFSSFISNPEFSDLHIEFDDPDQSKSETVYVHSVLLLSVLFENNSQLIENIKFLRDLSFKNNNNGVIKISFEKFLKLSPTTEKNQEIIKKILEQPLTEQKNQFIDFITFIYTNNTSRRNAEALLNFHCNLYKCKPLEAYLVDYFRYISPDSNLKIPDQLYSASYNSRDFFSDCVVVNSDGLSEIYCHKIILSRLPYFKKLITESSETNKDGLLKLVIENKEINSPQLTLIISFLYSDRIKLVSIPSNYITGNFILSLYQNSKVFEMKRFEEGLLKLVSQSVTDDNANALLNWSTLHKASPLTLFINAFLGRYLPPKHIESGREGLYKPMCPLPNERIIEVSVGQKLMVALTDDNKIYQLGYGSDLKKNTVNLIKIPSPDTSRKIIKVSCGSSHALAITEDYKVYGWGCGLEGQIIENKRKMFSEPELIINGDYSNMKAGFYSALFWNDLSTFPLNFNDEKSSNNNTDITKEFEGLNLDDKQITLEIYNPESIPNNRLWYFKHLKQFKDIIRINQKNNIQPTLSIIKTNVSMLPPFLLKRYIQEKQSGDVESLSLFGFSKETLELLLSLKETTNQELKLRNLAIIQSINSGDQLIDLLFLSTSLGCINITSLIFQHLKNNLNLTDSILLLSLIYESNYTLQLSFLFNYLLGVLNHEKYTILKNNDLTKLIPNYLLNLIIQNNLYLKLKIK